MINATQVAQWEIDIKYFRDQLDRLRTENAVLRELVREVLSGAGLNYDGSPRKEWDERAEKALGD